MRNGLSLGYLAVLALSAGLAVPAHTVRPGAQGLAWRRPRNMLWKSSPERIEAAKAKRERKGAILLRNAKRGAFGRTYRVEQPYTYVPNYGGLMKAGL